MSFSISISGHSGQKHNDQVKAAVDAAVTELRKVEGITGSLTGYTWDGGGEENRVAFSVDLAVPSEASPAEPAEEAEATDTAEAVEAPVADSASAPEVVEDAAPPTEEAQADA